MTGPELPPLASMPRRIIAIAVDWAAATAISVGFFDHHPMATLGVFALMTFLTVGTIGASPGHFLTGIAVRTPGRGYAGLRRGLIRTVLLCLVIPAVVWGKDGRGLHDMAAGTTITRIR